MLPVIDVAPAVAGDSGARRAAADQIHAACIDHGFFYIVGHGVSQHVIAQAFSSARAFFALPEDEKQKVASEAAGVVSADKVTNELTVKQ